MYNRIYMGIAITCVAIAVCFLLITLYFLLVTVSSTHGMNDGMNGTDQYQSPEGAHSSESTECDQFSKELVAILERQRPNSTVGQEKPSSRYSSSLFEVF